ncbi:diguanylate cyclase [Thiovibrio frasassiensis]|uniref:Diguanylate cyclase n=1 Tax=Thiovibrio frasassiensis TaxID=2984131 RepID=A0A9X4RLM6_9BACT|nr:diguanylate cyclase [Thiovibrio frasassiensis]MDG4475490.1 diguanylate cyclase [Thiovibrio frasassiensis]
MKTILVVDNHPVVLKLLVEFLKRMGHEVISAEDGLAALEILKKVTPDIVFTDLIMPNISGEKLCQVIRSRPELKEVHIIIYSSTMLEDEAHILSLGAAACIAKGPFKNTEAHIAQVIEHIDNGTLPALQGKILGGEDLYKRHITSELLCSKRHYEIIFNSMPEGVMEFTLEGKIFHANAAAMGLCGLQEENLLASSFFDLFTGEHRERVRALLHSPGQDPVIIDDTAPILLNGKMITIHFLPSQDEEHTFIIAIMRDLTEKITAARELELLRHQQERILNTVSEGIFGLDQENHVTFVNPAALAMLGYEPHDLAALGNKLHEIVHYHKPDGRAYPLTDCPIHATGQDGIVRKGTETFWRKNGESFPVRYTATPIQEDYEITGTVVTFADITERKKMEEKLRESAMTDELTSLFNRRGFMTLADKLIKISVRDKNDLLLVYVDFDNLKWINDTLGHSVGDQALIEAATLLQDTFRLADIVARLGGDEFVILCTDNSALGNERNILIRLNETIEKTNRMTNRQYPLSLSVGVGRFEHLSPCSIDDLLRQADQAMYKNKGEKKTLHLDGYKH